MSAEPMRRLTARDAAIRTRFHLAGVILLVVGLPLAALIYRRTPADDGGVIIGYDIEGGNVFPIKAGQSKRDEYQMQTMGGTANVAATEFVQWFASLWHGRRLAYTTVVLAGGSSAVCFFFAHFVVFPPPAEPRNDGKGDSTRGG